MAAERVRTAARLRIRGTVRGRTTAVAVLVVGIALILAAAVVVALLRRSQTADIRATTLLRAQFVVDGLASGDLQRLDSIPVGDPDEAFVQVLASDWSVVMSSVNLEGDPAIVRLAPGESRQIGGLQLEQGPRERATIEHEPFLVVSAPATMDERDVTVIVGASLETVEETSSSVIRILAVAIPLLLIVVAVTTFRLVGRALAPVEAIRSEVESISTSALHRRVPDPPGSDEIARLASTMNLMLDRLERGQVRQRRFVSDASHELRSPVAAIRQHAEVALSHPDGTTSQELAEVVLEEDVRLQHLAEDLLMLAKLDEGTLKVRAKPVDLDDLLFEEAARLRRTTELRIDTRAVSGGRVSGDPEQLGKLVRNLAENAARHAHGQVVLSLRETNGQVVLMVDDDGDGIPPEERDRIFERFVRLDDSRTRDSGGSGLGLAIVSEIVSAHGGQIAVTDAPAGGARFEVKIPSGST